MIKLSQNENPLGPGELVKQVLREEIARVALYPPVEGEPLVLALAEHYQLDPQRIVISNGSGSISILLMIAQHFTEQGGSVMFSGQGYIHFLFGNMKRGGALDFPFSIAPKNNHRHDLEAMVELAQNNDVRVIIIENPDNPTGAWIEHERFAAFMKAVPDDVIVVMDGAYAEYAGYALGAAYPNVMQLQERHPNLISVRTFSKAYGLAGLRVGYAIAVPDIAIPLSKRRIKLSLPSLGMSAACAALKDKQHLQHSLEMNQAGMAYLETAFDDMGVSYIKSAANFIMFDAGNEDAVTLAAQLKEQNILVLGLAAYGLPTHLRVNTGLPEENRAFTDSLKQVLSTRQSTDG